MAADTLSGGADDAAPRRRWLFPLLIALAVVALAATGLERWERQRQLDRLLDGAQATEQVIADSRRSLAGLVTYSEPLLSRSDLEPAQRAAVLDSLAVDAARFPPRLLAPRSIIEDVRPLPWDDDLETARQAYLERIDAWTALVDATRAAPEDLLFERRLSEPEREAAARALLEAAGDRSADRVDDVRSSLLPR